MNPNTTTLPDGRASSPDTTAVRDFYDEFSARLVHDYVYGNRRVNLIREFERRSIHPDTRSILEVGCGSGANADFLARKVAPRARVTAVDLSSSNIAIATALFDHPRIEFLEADALTLKLEQKFEVIIVPDVYEHLPKAERARMNKGLGRLLADDGRILLTCPAPGYFDWMRENGHALQVIDEVVSLRDAIDLAEGVGGQISYLAMVSVGLTNEYLHIVIERGALACRRVAEKEKLPIKMYRPYTLATRMFNRISAVPRMARVMWKSRGLRRSGRVPRIPWDHRYFRKGG